MADNNLHKIYENFDNDVLQMIIHAKAANITLDVDCLYPESFVIGILTTGANPVNASLARHNINLEKCLQIFKKKLSTKKNKNQLDEAITYSNMKKSKLLVDVCMSSEKISKSLSETSKNINLQHVFIAILQTCLEIRKTFEDLGLDITIFIDEIKQVNKIEKSPKKKTKEDKETQENEKQNSILENFCTDMTEMAKNNKYDPIVSRDEEIENTITVLCRRNKSNPILVGEAGVGKTAIIEGICQRIISGTVPKKLINCKIFGLNMGALVAGTKYRGDFEVRIQNLIKTIIEDPNSILFIDEIHTIVGAGSASGSMDAANILKPALARDLRCIGATTSSEYKKYFVGEGALERRFEKINIDEPTHEQTRKILLGIKPKLEEFHNCTISDEAISSAIKLSDRYITTRFFPDKAIDCLDIACAKYIWKDIEKPIVNETDIANVISKQCQVPIEIIMLNNNERIKKVEETLNERVMGQPHVIKSICRTLKNAYSGIRNHNKPIGIFVFGGQSGTGKTYLAMAMAVSFLLEKKVNRIVLARPAVEAGEKLGFLPGDLAEKVNPYLRPLYDALFDMIDFDKASALIHKGVIEVAPLAFMRGRTLNDSFVILDEAQNTTSEQMKMFLTRLGFGSKAVITGDITQIDLPHEKVSGLIEAETILKKVEGIKFVHFSEIDVVRHPLVQDVIRAYNHLDRGKRKIKNQLSS